MISNSCFNRAYTLGFAILSAIATSFSAYGDLVTLDSGNGLLAFWPQFSADSTRSGSYNIENIGDVTVGANGVVTIGAKGLNISNNTDTATWDGNDTGITAMLTYSDFAKSGSKVFIATSLKGGAESGIGIYGNASGESKGVWSGGTWSSDTGTSTAIPASGTMFFSYAYNQLNKEGSGTWVYNVSDSGVRSTIYSATDLKANGYDVGKRVNIGCIYNSGGNNSLVNSSLKVRSVAIFQRTLTESEQKAFALTRKTEVTVAETDFSSLTFTDLSGNSTLNDTPLDWKAGTNLCISVPSTAANEVTLTLPSEGLAAGILNIQVASGKRLTLSGNLTSTTLCKVGAGELVLPGAVVSGQVDFIGASVSGSNFTAENAAGCGTVIITSATGGSCPVSGWLNFDGTIEYAEANGMLDMRNCDLSKCTFYVTGSGAMLKATVGKEGKINVSSGSTLELYANIDTYLYEGYIPNCGTIDGTLSYFYTDSGSVDHAAANDSKLGNNLLPYYQIFTGTGSATTYAGNLNTPSDWKGSAVPGTQTGRTSAGNAAFKVESGATLTVTVDADLAFGDVQVYGGPGKVVFDGSGSMSIANGFYIADDIEVELRSGVSFGTGSFIKGGTLKVASGSTVSSLKNVDVSTLKVDGSVTTSSATINASNLTVNGSFDASSTAVTVSSLSVGGTINVSADSTLTPSTSVSGAGAITWNNKQPSGNLWRTCDGWTGTNTVTSTYGNNENGIINMDPYNWGNRNSYIVFKHASGYFTNNTNAAEAETILENGGSGEDEYALQITNGGSSYDIVFRKISGDGTIKDVYAVATTSVYFLNADDFHGSINQTVSGRRFYFAPSASGKSGSGGQISVLSNGSARIAEDMYWTSGSAGIYIYGRLAMAAGAELRSAATLIGTLTFEGAATAKENLTVSGNGATIALGSSGALTCEKDLTFASGAKLNFDISGMTLSHDTSNPTLLVTAGSLTGLSETLSNSLGLKDFNGRTIFTKDETHIYVSVKDDEWNGASGDWTSSQFDGSSDYSDGEGLDVFFSSSANEEVCVTLDGTRTPVNVTFDGVGTTYTLTGGTFSPSGTVTVKSGNVIINSAATGTYVIEDGATLTLANATSVTVSGAGKLIVPENGAVTAGGTLSHTGGTQLGANAVLTTTYAYGLGTGAIEGEKTSRIVYGGIDNMSTNPTPNAGWGLTDSEHWQGIFEFCDTYMGLWQMSLWGNEESTIRLNGVKSYLYVSNDNYSNDFGGALDISAGGWELTGDYNSEVQFSTDAKLTGCGEIKVSVTGNNNKSLHFAGDASYFGGSITFGSSSVNTRVLFGDAPASFTAKSIVVGAGAAVTAAAGTIWTAQNGVSVDGENADFALESGATLSDGSGGNGTLAISNSGEATLKGGSWAGTVTVAAGSTLNLDPGATDWICNALIRGAGDVEFVSGNITFSQVEIPSTVQETDWADLRLATSAAVRLTALGTTYIFVPSDAVFPTSLTVSGAVAFVMEPPVADLAELTANISGTYFLVYDLAEFTAAQLASPISIPAGVTVAFTNSSEEPVEYSGALTVNGTLMTLADASFPNVSFGSSGALEVTGGAASFKWDAAHVPSSLTVGTGAILAIDATDVDVESAVGKVVSIVDGPVVKLGSITVETSSSEIGWSVDSTGITIGKGGYWRWTYADDIVTWTTPSDGVSDIGGAAKFALFDRATGTDTSTSYTGNAKARGDTHFWTSFCYASVAYVNSIATTPNYVVPGLVVRLKSGDFQKTVGGSFGPLAMAGLIVEEGATGYSFTQAVGTGIRTTILGDPTGVREAWSVINEDVSIAGRQGDTVLVGTNNIEVAAGKTLTLDPTQGYTLSICGALERNTTTYIGVKSPGGALKMHGEGTITVASAERPLDARSGVTLDYSDLAPDRAEAFIQGSIVVDDSTRFDFPAGTVFPYKVATRIEDTTTADGCNPYTVGGVPGTKKLVFDDEAGTVYEVEYEASSLSSNTAWNDARDSGTLKLNVTDDMTLTLNAAVELESLWLYVSPGKTLVIAAGESGSLTVHGCTFVTGGGTVEFAAPLDYGRIAVEGGSVVTSSTAANIAKFRGNGTVQFVGVRPSTAVAETATLSALDAYTWSGTVWVKDYTTNNTRLFSEYWGNDTSKIKWTNVRGHIMYGSHVAEWILEDGEGGKAALTRSDGYGNNDTNIARISGSGTFVDDANPTQRFNFREYSRFTGSITIPSNRGMGVVFGETSGGSTKTILIPSTANVTVADGAAWSAPNVTVNGTLINASENAVEAPTLTVGGTIEGKFNGGTAENPGTLILNAPVDPDKVELTNYKYVTINAGVAQSDLGGELGAFSTLTLNGSATYTTTAGEEGVVHFGENNSAVLTLKVTGAYVDLHGYTPIVATGDGTIGYYCTDTPEYNVPETSHIAVSGYSLLPYYHVWTVAEGYVVGDLNESERWGTNVPDPAQPGSATAENEVHVAFNMISSDLITVNVKGDDVTYTDAQIYGEVNGKFVKDGETVMTLGKIYLITGATLYLDGDSGVVFSNMYLEKGTTLVLEGGVWNAGFEGYGTILVPEGKTATISGTVAGALKVIVEAGGRLILNATTISAPITAYGTVEAASGTVSMASAANMFYGGSVFQVDGGAAVTGGTLQMRGGSIKGSGTGTASISGMTVNLRDSINVDIDDGLTVNATGSKLTSSSAANALLKTGEGTLNITGSTSYAGLTTVSEGVIVSTALPTGNVTIEEGAKYTLKDCAWSEGDKFTGEGTLELLVAGSSNIAYSCASSFQGILNVHKTDTGWPALTGTSPQYANRPQFDLTGNMAISEGFANDEGSIANYLAVRNFNGSGNIDAAYASTDKTRRFISTLQTRDTLFSGAFNAASSGRYAALQVLGEDSAAEIHSLTLSGDNKTPGELVVTNNAKVVFTSTGKWASGTVTVCKDGWLESSNSVEVASTLALGNGANIVRTTVPLKATKIAAIDGGATINVLVDDIATPSGIYEIMEGAWDSTPSADRFAFADASFRGFGFYVQGHTDSVGGRNAGLYICPATVTLADGTIEPYGSVVDAVAAVETAITDAQDAGVEFNYQYISVYADATLTQSVNTLKLKIADGVSVSVASTHTGYGIKAEQNTETGIVTYTQDSSGGLNFVWAGSASGDWFTPGNWTIGGNTAERPPYNSLDTVTFNSSATVNMNGPARVTSVTVAKGCTLTLTGDRALTTADGALVVTPSGSTGVAGLEILNASPYAGVAITAEAVTVPVGSKFKDINSTDVTVSGTVASGTKLFTLTDTTPVFAATTVTTSFGAVHYTNTSGVYTAGRTYWWKGATAEMDLIGSWARNEELSDAATDVPRILDTAIFNVAGAIANVPTDATPYNISVLADAAFKTADGDSARTLGTAAGDGTVETVFTIANGVTATLRAEGGASRRVQLAGALEGSGLLVAAGVSGYAGTGVDILADTSAFTGTVDLQGVTGVSHSLGAAAVNNAASRWNIYTNGVTSATSPFLVSATSYGFGSLAMTANPAWHTHGSTFTLGSLGDSSIAGSWNSSDAPKVVFAGGPARTLSLSAANLSELELTNGGTVVFTGSSAPKSKFSVSGSRAIIKSTDYTADPTDATAQFSVTAGLTVEVADGATWTWDGTPESVTLEGGLMKTGGGTLRMVGSGASFTNVGLVTVQAGLAVVDNGGAITYTLGEGTACSVSGTTYNFGPAVAKIGTTMYLSLADAVAAATSSSTIELLSDTTESISISGAKTLKIDTTANEYTYKAPTLSGEGAYAMKTPSVSGTVTTYESVNAAALITRSAETTYYASIDDAVNAASSTDTIRLLTTAADYGVSSALTLSGAKFALDKKLAVSGSAATLNVSGSGTTVTLDGDGTDSGKLTIGSGASSTVNVTGGAAMTANGLVSVEASSTQATLNVGAGSTFNARGGVNVAGNAAGTSKVDISGTLAVTGTVKAGFGEDATADINLKSGSFTVSGDLELGHGALSDDSAKGGSTGEFTQSGGTATVTGDLKVGLKISDGIARFSAGSFTANRLLFGESGGGAGAVTVDGTATVVEFTNGIVFGNGKQSKKEDIAVSGGRLKMRAASVDTSAAEEGSTILLDGGIVEPLQTSNDFIGSGIAVKIGDGGAVFDVATGKDITIQRQIVKAAGDFTPEFTLKGNGVVNLSYALPAGTVVKVENEGGQLVVAAGKAWSGYTLGEKTGVHVIGTTYTFVHVEDVDVDIDGEAGDKTIAVGGRWIAANMWEIAAGSRTAALAVDSKTRAPNGYRYFECYVMGLDPEAETSGPILNLTGAASCFDVQLEGLGTIPEGVKLLIGVKAYTDAACSIEADGEGSEGQLVITSAGQTGSATVAFPSANIRFYKAAIDVDALSEE